MTNRTKPLTEGGSLGFNRTPKSIKHSVMEYQKSLDNFFVQKELNEYVGRFKWEGLPPGLDENILETMLYYKGQLAFFKLADMYYVLPFVYTGPINQYGVQQRLIPISFNGVIGDDKSEDKNKPFATEREAIFYERDITGIDKEDLAIVIKSNSSLYLNNVIPNIVVTNEIRDKLAENLILVRNNLILSQPMKYIMAQNEKQADSLRMQVDNMMAELLNGNVVQAIVGPLSLEDFNSEKPGLQAQHLWQSFSSLDNLRMEYLGIMNNGVFEKKERFLTDEVAGKQTVSKLLLQDGLDHRKRFCKLANKYFGLDIKVDISEIMKPVLQEEPDNREVGGPKDEV